MKYKSLRKILWGRVSLKNLHNKSLKGDFLRNKVNRESAEIIDSRSRTIMTMRQVAITALALILSLCVAGEVWAECANNQTCGTDCCWSIENGTLNIVGSGSNATMSGYDVYTDQPWYSQKDNFTSVNISGVNNVGYRAFQKLDNVTNVTLSDSVTDIEHRAFWGTSITSIDLNKVETIGQAAFNEANNLSSVSMPNVSSIGRSAFYNNSITSVDLPTNLTSLGEYAFYGNQLTSIDIPDGITSIGRAAFYGNQLTSVDIPDSITDLGDYAFSHNSLTSVNIPESVISMGNYAFGNNELTEVTIPSGVTSLSEGVFYGNQLTSVDIPEGVTSIGDVAFYNNQLTSLNIPEGVTSIGDYAFMYNELPSVNIPDSVTSIGIQAFLNNELTEVIIPETVSEIGDWAFWGNPLENVVIPDTIDITKLGNELFCGVGSVGGRSFSNPKESCINIKFICKGSETTCEAVNSYLENYQYDDADGWHTFPINDKLGLANEAQCNSTNYYWNGRSCNYEPDAESRVCDHEISGYVKVGNYCASPEVTYAKKRYTPAEANQWLRDGNDNYVVITFKK